LRKTLEVQNFRTVEAAGGHEALEALRREKPDLIILDLGLPDIDGLEVIKTVRQTSPTPIVILSSRGDEAGKVAALDLGADDYVTKPFGVNELMARVRAALRHRLQEQGSQSLFQAGDLTVDLVHRRVTVGGSDVRLSPKEYDILQQMVLHAGKVLTHRHLIHEVWRGAENIDVQALRVFIRQLRQKIEATPEQPRHIVTEPGVGYRLQVSE
jgi:two-component system KDP operon response regulator KdpE